MSSSSIDMPSPSIDMPSPSIDMPSPSIDMPSSFTEMPHASVDRPSSRIMASLLIGFLAVAAGARADTLTGRELVAALRSGGYVIVMRHARSPSAPPDANSANPDNPTHERQLDEAGRASAREMGEALR